MKQKIIIFFVLILATLAALSIQAVADEYEVKIEIEITTLDGREVEQVYRGDVFRVTVFMTDFPNLVEVKPSLHFNQNVVKVSDSQGRILQS